MPNPFAHAELSTGDLKAAKKFYQAVFAWTLRDLPAMKYTMIDVGKGVGGGMQKKPMKGMPTAWMPYVEVADVKKTLATAKKAGAQITLGYTSIGEMGAIGVFVDPTGASLGVWEMGKAAAGPAAKSAKPAAKSAKAAKKASKKAGKKK
jgi:predicted enzyme related to lactoylglutathione lyase